MFSVALGELEAPSLDYVLYDMTWAEFQLRLFAYKRKRKAEQADLREVGWAALYSFHSDPKKLPKTIEGYWPIYGEDKKSKLTPKHLEAFKAAWADYEKQRDERKVKG